MPGSVVGSMGVGNDDRVVEPDPSRAAMLAERRDRLVDYVRSRI